MRIAYLSIGRHLHTERWIRFFAERGHECHLLTVQPGALDGVLVHDIRAGGSSKPMRYARSLRRVRALLDRIEPDILHTHFLTGYGYWGHFSGFRPNVLTVWGDDVYVTPHQTALKKWLARQALRSAAAVTGDSVDILRHCVALGASPEACFEVQWGVDFDVFRPERPEQLRAELGIPGAAPLVLSPRSFTKAYYNIDVVIAACAAVAGARPDAHFVFAGYEGDSRPFEDMAREAALPAERTHFVGRLDHARFADLLAASDVFVSVPSVDATAVSLLEAMASGCGIVVSALASSLEWIEHDVTGVVVEPGDRAALAAAIGALIGEPERRRDMADKALRVVRARADHHVHMERVEELYRSLANGPTAAPVGLSSLTARGLA